MAAILALIWSARFSLFLRVKLLRWLVDLWASAAMVTAGLILSFYSIVAGWMLAFMLEPITAILGQANLGQWLTEDSLVRNVGFSAFFVLLTVLIISAGVEQV